MILSSTITVEPLPQIQASKLIFFKSPMISTTCLPVPKQILCPFFCANSQAKIVLSGICPSLCSSVPSASKNINFLCVTP